MELSPVHALGCLGDVMSRRSKIRPRVQAQAFLTSYYGQFSEVTESIVKAEYRI